MPGLNLTQVEAQERAKAIVKVDSYNVNLDLDGGDRVFRSVTSIDFDAVPGSSTFIDLVAEKLHSVRLNGTSLDVGLYEDYRFPLTNLQEKNVLEVDGDFFYMHTGEGMHRSVDPEDGKVYLYTQFEVPDARRVYPTFEQPDLKASFTFTVVTPKEWKVFSISPTPEPVDLGDSWRFDFAPTKRISTYITAVVAGPYEGKTATIQSTDGSDVELGVYCRASLVKYLDADRIIDITESGFNFFENAYGIPYPFGKYDQIFVPEFNAGAMENAGCVTFRDQYVFRSKPTEWQLESRTNTILHELAHMWFGNLVTMQWWDDLWLNESFAEYMAHLATSEATKWKDAWVGFMGRKEWGLDQDQKPTTHPIRAEIRDLDDVEVNFDGITYAKGAAVLRQMVSYVGRENFFEGLNQYLTKNAYGNATLTDLLSELEAASGRDMERWTKVWLEESGVTTLRPEIVVDSDGKVTALDVVQEATADGVSLRPHRLIVSGYSLDDEGEVQQVFSEELDVDGERTSVPSALGEPKPDFVLVNDQDLAYAKVRMDADSLAFAVENIAKFDNALTRRVLTAAAWDMTRDGEMPARTFLDLALKDLQVEDSVPATASLLIRIDQAVARYTAPVSRASRMESVADRLSDLVRAAAAGSDEQRMFVQALARLAVTEEQYNFLSKIFANEEVPEGLKVDTDLRWEILFALVRSGRAGEAEIAALQSEDPTLTGSQNAARARATIGSSEVRDKTWEAIMHDVEIPNDTRWAMVAGFWSHATRVPLEYQRFIEPFFDQVDRAWDEHTFQIASRIVETMFPLPLVGYIAGANIVERAGDWLEEHAERPDSLKRLITECRSDSERMLKAQAADARW